VIERKISRQYCTGKIRADYAHVGIYDAQDHRAWIARKRFGIVPIRVNHARLLANCGDDSSTADKDRFVCYWFHTPNSGEGFVHGYPIDWGEGHLLIRLDPNWDYATRRLISPAHTKKVEHNIEQQYQWGKKIFEAYVGMKPKFPLSWHMIGPRATDSLFYIQRVESLR